MDNQYSENEDAQGPHWPFVPRWLADGTKADGTKLSGTEFRLLLYLWSWVRPSSAKGDDPSMSCTPEQITDATGIKRTARIAALKVLEDEGWLLREPAHRNKTTVFHLRKGVGNATPKQLERMPEKRHPNSRKGCQECDTQTNGKGVGFPDERVSDSRTKGCRESDTPRTPIRSPIRNQSPQPPGGADEPESLLFDPDSGSPGVHPPKPVASRRLTKAEKKRLKIDANTPVMVRISSWFRQKPGRLWTIAEAEALADVDPSAEDLDLVEAYYQASRDEIERAKEAGQFVPERSTDILTLLNKWPQKVQHAEKLRQFRHQQNKPEADKYAGGF